MLSRHEMQKYTGYADDDPSLEGPERICVFVPLIHSVKINAFTANISEASWFLSLPLDTNLCFASMWHI